MCIRGCECRLNCLGVLNARLDFGSKPIERQLILSAQFLHNELPVRLAHRVAELENLPYGLSAKPHVLKVRDWYVESFKELRGFPKVKDASDEVELTKVLNHIYTRHRNVVPVMAMGVAGKALCCYYSSSCTCCCGGGGGSISSCSTRSWHELMVYYICMYVCMLYCSS